MHDNLSFERPKAKTRASSSEAHFFYKKNYFIHDWISVDEPIYVNNNSN